MVAWFFTIVILLAPQIANTKQVKPPEAPPPYVAVAVGFIHSLGPLLSNKIDWGHITHEPFDGDKFLVRFPLRSSYIGEVCHLNVVVRELVVVNLLKDASPNCD